MLLPQLVSNDSPRSPLMLRGSELLRFPLPGNRTEKIMLSITILTHPTEQKNAPAPGKKMSAVPVGVHHFRTHPESQTFLLHTGLQCLGGISPTTKEPEGRRTRQIRKLAEMDFQIIHTPGRDDAAAQRMHHHDYSTASYEPASVQ